MAVLHQDYDEEQFHRKLNGWESDLLRYIMERDSAEYSQILMQDGRWEIFYHLSPMRQSLLNWYEFDENAEILEIGGGFGALTGLLCSRGLAVTSVENSVEYAQAIAYRHRMCANLDIYVRDFKRLQLEKKYDYIILVGVLEKIFDGKQDLKLYSGYLQYLCSFLRDSGRILLAVSNRLGVRHFCGVKDDFTREPFAGINRYPKGSEGYAFTRNEIMNVTESAGLKGRRFYYPLPDYKLPQAVYSEEYLPTGKICDRVMPYYPDKSDLVAVEADLRDEFIANGVFEALTDSFLVECCVEAKQISDIMYAAVSTDREAEHSFATVIHSDGVVLKRALCERGIDNLKLIYNNAMDMQAHGLKVIDHELVNDEIRMPYIKEKSMLEFLHETIGENTACFLGLMDKMYECILKSSEHVPAELNELAHDACPDAEMGIILKCAYIDMVPMNSFWMENDIYFFDQEFVRTNYPAKYIMFRNVLYYYIFNPEDESCVPQKELMERYGLSELWNVFLDEENKFVSQNRNWRLYGNYYGWTMLDRDAIYGRYANAGKPEEIIETEDKPVGEKEAVGTQYSRSEQLIKVQALEKQILQEFHNICVRNGLKYYAMYGTLIGAVRHHDMIPWDDDIDVAMPREDYEKFIRLAKDALKEPLFLQTPESDPACFYGGYMKLRYSLSTGMDVRNWCNGSNQGIYIDIFPLDNFICCNSARGKNVNRIRKVQELLFAKTYGWTGASDFGNIPRGRWRRNWCESRFLTKKKLCKLLKQCIMDGNASPSPYYCIKARYLQMDDYRFIRKEVFADRVEVPFGDGTIYIPKLYHECLNVTMGLEYMDMPPAELLKPHHLALFSTRIPYKQYVQRFDGALRIPGGKQIIIWGAGSIFYDYMERAGGKNPPSHVIDDDMAKWGSLRCNCMIEPPEILQSIPLENMHLIICSRRYQMIEARLEQFGIGEYYIFGSDKLSLVNYL